ncbi:MAG: preprotein translocase subunit YajC [Flavobacteriales bacterium]|nr:preprotein translocase subunit YajC [Flavobacteriales bacterium]
MNQIILQASTSGGGMSMIIMLVAFIAVMYFLMIRPQQKRQKQEKKFLTELQKGQWVVTIGGIHGRLVEINETTALIDTKAGQITFERSAISRDLTMARYGNKEVK